ncbi:MAG: c-type cytochrome [Deltaproteobacteria bacterium]|nr:c-type cytochrome [Deltaproteobacteria bacterium]
MNHTKPLLITSLVVLFAGGLLAQKPQPKAAGIEAQGYKWNAEYGEKMEAMKKKGDVTAGEEAYETCAACHLPSGAGRPDGTFPQLAGQHPSVVIKQIADIRAGLRDNPIMYPFAITLTDPQQLANVSAYIQSLPIPHDNGKGPGAELATGKRLYERDCQTCHGANGEGDASKFYPVLAGQHYKYMLRQATDIRDGRRRNANPDMVKVIKPYTDKDIDAIVDYMSRLQMPDKKAAAKKK